MKKTIGFAMFAMLIFLIACARANTSDDVAQIGAHGTLQIAGEALTTTFVVTIGTPHFAIERAGLSSIFGVYLANSKFYIHIPGKGWVMQERRLPTSEDLTKTFHPNDLIVQIDVGDDSMPSWFRSLPQGQKENIECFFAFYSGAYRILLRDQSEARAEDLAEAINVKN